MITAFVNNTQEGDHPGTDSSIDITSSWRLFAVGTEPGRKSLPAGMAWQGVGKGRYGDRGRQKANRSGRDGGTCKVEGRIPESLRQGSHLEGEVEQTALAAKKGKPNCGLVLAGLTCSPLGSHRRRPLTIYYTTFFSTKRLETH